MIKYVIASLKKTKSIIFFPLIYSLPILILISLNLIGLFGNKYMLYTFITNGSFNYVTENMPLAETSTFVTTVQINGKYSEENSYPGTNYYGTNIVSKVFFTSNTANIPYKKNLLKGKSPNKNIYDEYYKQGYYPICITYNAAIGLKADIGDIVYCEWEYIEKQDDGSFVKEIYKLAFKISGILKSDGNKSNEFEPLKGIDWTYSFAIVDNKVMEKLPFILYRSEPENSYIIFSDEKINYSSVTKEQKAKDLIVFKSFYRTFSFSLSVVIILSLFNMNLTVTKVKKDVSFLNKLGLSKKHILLTYFSLYTIASIVILFITFLIIKYILLPYVFMEYYSTLFLIYMALFQLLVGIVIATIYLVLRRS